MAARVTSARRRLARRLAVLALALAVSAVAAPGASAQVVLDSGHVDAVAPTVVGGQLSLKVKDGTTPGSPVLRDPAEVVFGVKPEARMAVPSGLPAGYAFLGSPGSTVWLLPQVQSDNPAVVWAGWSSEAIAAGQFAGDQLHWRLVGVDGPGPVQLYETDTFGSPRLFFDSADGLPDTEVKAVGVHSHFSWVFHAPGLHRLRFEVAGTPAASSTPITTGPVEYRFQVDGPAAGGRDGDGGAGGGTGGGDTGGPGDARQPPKLRAGVTSARSNGRVLSLRLRVTRASRVSIAVVRRGRAVARAKSRRVRAGQRRLRFRLDRRLAPGRYRVRVTVRSGARKLVRSARLRVRAPKRSAATTVHAAAARGSGAATRAVARPAASDATVLDDGHVDYGAKLVDGKLESLVKDGTQGANEVVWREPSEVVFHVGTASRSTIPKGGGLNFLGQPGASVWMLPQVQKAGLLWPGWNTEDRSLTRVSGPVTWKLLAVDGPGEVAVFQTGSFGQAEVIFASGDGLPDSYRIPLGVHAHGNWAFSAEGVYRLRFEMSVSVGGRTQTDVETLAVAVGNTDPSAVEPVGTDSGDASAGEDAGTSAGHGAAEASGDGGSSTSEASAGGLPHTGADLAPLLAGGLGLLAFGTALRRRT
jgi:putative ABC transporter-associated repeat protein